MKINSLYSVKIKDCNHIFKESVAIYRSAVDFLIAVCLNDWDAISIQDSTQRKKAFIERLRM